MKNLLQFSLVALLIFSFSQTTQAQAAYIKLGDIKGESVDKKHRGWIDILTFDSGIPPKTNPKAFTRVPDPVTPPTKNSFPGDLFVFTKKIDAASPKIQQAVVQGEGFSKIEFEYFDRRTKTKLRIEFFDVKITGLNIKEDRSGMIEEVTLGYTEVEWTYVKGDRRAQGTDSSKLEAILESLID